MTDSGSLIASRASVYSGLRALPSLKESFPLVTVYDIGQKNLEQLQYSVTNFILASLRLCHGRNFKYRPDFLTAYGAEIASLSNLTPNGACYPKRETILEYNILHRDVVTACRDNGVLQHLKALTPLALRIMSGESTEEKDHRPYSTAKVHSDAWVGHQSDGVVSLLVMGDIEGTRIQFYEPVDPTPNFFDELADYDLGKERFRELKSYPTKPQLGHLCLFDHLALHQTVRAKGGTRVSIGFAYSVDSPASRGGSRPQEKFDYMTRDEWAAIGSTSVQIFEESMGELGKLYGAPGTEASKRPFAPFRTVDLWPREEESAAPPIRAKSG